MTNDFEISVIPGWLLKDAESVFSDPDIRRTQLSDLARYTGCHPLITSVTSCWTDQSTLSKKNMLTIDNTAQIVKVPITANYPCIRPVVKLSDTLFDQLAKGKKTVFLGRFPQTFVGSKKSDTLTYIDRLSHQEQEDIGFCDAVYCYSFNIYPLESDYVTSKLAGTVLFEGEEYVRLDHYHVPPVLYRYNENDYWSHPYWFKVEPVEWIVDEKNRLLIAKKGLLSGFPMGKAKFLKSYDESLVKEYIDIYWRNDLRLWDSNKKEKEKEKLVPFIVKDETLTPDKRLVLIKERLRLLRQAIPEQEEAVNHLLYHLTRVEEELEPCFQKIKK